ncbi:MAG: aldo/keto reductase [Methylobacteriaceae bacterium]|jgi:diketogulonate reductase-like aldo/keto reductase|nr:aldo/keto reductase [Methylobacteriaceae bacterium]
MSEHPILPLSLPSGAVVPRLGQGTWYMGDRSSDAAKEAAALRLGVDLGMTLIDTAEMYADGGAERVVGKAVEGIRDKVFIVSKVLPSNASRKGTIEACERSLRRMNIDVIDLYLLHWRGHHPFEHTVDAFEKLMSAGKIKAWGVSNMDVSDMSELLGVPGGKAAATNQVLYNLSRRGVEFDLLPWQRKNRMPVMAYSPIEQGRLLRNATLGKLAAKHGATPAQIALSWVLRDDNVIAIPKAANPIHVKENRAAADIVLPAEDLGELDKAFPPPTRARPLEML